jgi:hypothetical protein
MHSFHRNAGRVRAYRAAQGLCYQESRKKCLRGREYIEGNNEGAAEQRRKKTLYVISNPLRYEGWNFVLIIMEDITNQKNRRKNTIPHSPARTSKSGMIGVKFFDRFYTT